MEITKVSETKPSENPHGVDARMIYDHENAQITHITLEAGERLKRHVTPVDVAFYVLEGKGIIEIGDEKREITRDSVVHSPANIVHCLYNETEAPPKDTRD
ncbi:MAG: cupin domain-containing protein [Candidatus Bathyarchaeia archaeon]